MKKFSNLSEAEEDQEDGTHQLYLQKVSQQATARQTNALKNSQ